MSDQGYPQPDGSTGFWVREGNGSLRHLERLLTEEEFARQHPDAYAYAVRARDLDQEILDSE